MNALAIAMFVCLFAFGRQIFGWTDHHGNVQIALVAAFLFGILSTWRTSRG
jgi:hypothetical protein